MRIFQFLSSDISLPVKSSKRKQLELESGPSKKKKLEVQSSKDKKKKNEPLLKTTAKKLEGIEFIWF